MTKSIWQSEPIPSDSHLNNSLKVDVCIVGAGIAGLTSAYCLVKQGQKVTLLHAGDLKAGETTKSTAQLNTVHDDSWAQMLNLHGEEKVKLCYQSYCAAFNFIEDLISTNNLNCKFEKLSSYLFSADESDGKWVDDELEAAKKAGVQGISKVKTTPLAAFQKGPALLYENQAQFQPLEYLSGLREILLSSGLCEIYGDSGVKDVEEGDLVKLTLDSGRVVSAGKVILATNTPIHRKLIPIEALAAYRSYVVTFKVKKDAIPRFQYWDNAEPYHYVRLEDPESDVLLVGGEDHRVAQGHDEEEHFAKLIAWGQKHFPTESVGPERWSAQTIETFDGMPLIGKTSSKENNIFIITGDSGMGITHGTIGGMMASEFAFGRATAWDDLYSPSRTRMKSLRRWVTENVENALAYQDWLTPGDVKSESEISTGSGAIIRDGLSKIAVYKSKNGEVTRLSAKCTHLGGVVRWNGVEKSWDCPVHGSRFSPTGEVLNGPATCGLACWKANLSTNEEANRTESEKSLARE